MVYGLLAWVNKKRFKIMATGNSTNANSTGIVTYNGSGTFTASTVTQYDILVGGASNAISSIGPGSAGQVLQSAGNASNPAYSTATYPASAGTSGNVITSDGTNFSSTAPATTLKTASGQLNSSQIKSLHGSPITLVSSPGLGKSIFVTSSLTLFVYGGTNVFVAGAGQTIGLYYSTSGSQILSLCSNVVITQNSNFLTSGVQTLSAVAQSLSENLPLLAYVSSATEISGNAANDNYISYVIQYYIISS